MHPFRDGDTFGTLQNLIKKVKEEITSLDNEYVLKASPVELEQYFIQKAHINPLILHVNEKYIKDKTGTKIDVSRDFMRAVLPGERALVSGTNLKIAIPFEGDSFLWRIRASTFSVSGYPEIEILANEIVFNVSFPDDSVSTAKLNSEIDRNIKSLSNAVEYLKRDVDNHNKSAPNIIQQALEQKLKMAKSTIGAIEGLGIPIKRTSEIPTFKIPVQRREAQVIRPAVASGKYEPEPVLEEKEYTYILEILRSMSLVIERNPSSFASLDEEAIRDHFLLQLNGHYEGSATGETFNASGKTDILIRVSDRNVFIAECKFWHGSKAFNEALDQLLSYLTWRDSKCALLIFNRTKDSSSVRQKMHEVMESRPEHRRTLSHDLTGDSQYIFIKQSDPGREIYITTQLYDVPSNK